MLIYFHSIVYSKLVTFQISHVSHMVCFKPDISENMLSLNKINSTKGQFHANYIPPNILLETSDVS